MIPAERARELKNLRRLYRLVKPDELRDYLLRGLDLYVQKETKLSEFTREEREAWDRQASQRAVRVRLNAWVKWLQRESWTIAEAAHLLDGRDPDSPSSGYDDAYEALIQETKETERRLEPLVKDKLYAVKGGETEAENRYRPVEIIAVAFVNHIGMAYRLLWHWNDPVSPDTSLSS